MKDYIVTIYQETYTEFRVKAESKEDADAMALAGEYDSIEDVTVKGSEVIHTEEAKD